MLKAISNLKENILNKSICKQIESMLCLYIENKLTFDERVFVKTHLKDCENCYKKYLEMKKIFKNLHFEYSKLMNELKNAEAEKVFNIREYENFYQNISPYIDDELCYEDSIKFRKYLLKSKSARRELANAYGLKNNIKNSIDEFKDKLNINFSKKVINELQGKNFNIFEKYYKNAAIFIAFLISTFILITIYLSFSYVNEAFASDSDKTIVKSIEIPNENDMIEFTFDENNNPLLIAK